jgi:hypothetical protein
MALRLIVEYHVQVVYDAKHNLIRRFYGDIGKLTQNLNNRGNPNLYISKLVQFSATFTIWYSILKKICDYHIGFAKFEILVHYCYNLKQ